MIPLSKYIRIKDRCCVAYFGACDEYVDQLLAARPHIERELPGIQVYVACRDEVFEKLKDYQRLVSYTQLKDQKDDFSLVREIRGENCVSELLKESKIPHPTLGR